ncbi:helix-turn-helix transcriptional regulator [Paenibacillus sp. KQZ6P-2]|uniref:Helix-turn-helix transcriptional regulator n=1 Tax=Paenibacillus mangrovi TaxID=2931978 RepID=A0A9X1WXB5_9BACL|nr:helix-turn-helix transcriptional regulator [Paenibacillus mangrovi]MCJ8015253.1 helix-turn-helix transcriptional regulator [Paenibacillus mangrovi]
MEKAVIIDKLIEEQGLSRRAFAEKIGLPATTLQSMLSRGVGKASIDNVIKVCKGLGITTDQLEMMSQYGTTDISEIEKKDKSNKLSEEQILTLAAHQIGHDGPLSNQELEQIKLAMKIALSKNK